MFDKLYDKMTDMEKKTFMESFIESIEIYRERQSGGHFVKTVHFNFPVSYNGELVREISPLKETTVETVVLLSKNKLEFMEEIMEVRINILTPELFLTLYQSVGWEPPCIEQVRIALENTIATFTCYDNNIPVGMVRLIGDGGISFYIKDFAVIPSYQGKGVGTLLMDHLEKYIKGIKSSDWAVSLELISSKEAIPFYKKKGFEERPCDWEGPGMFKMVR